MTAPRCNRERLWNTLMTIGEIGHVEVEGSKAGGCHRLALTAKDKQARDLFISWAEALGCSLRVDAIGNLFLRREGADSSLAPVMTGSHLDTQPTGGKFDGVYGCIAGLEVLRCLHELEISTRRPIEVAVWTNEEGARFKPAMLGSGVFAGVFSLQEALETQDAGGVRVVDALSDLGYATQAADSRPDYYQYYELHIEQGPVLEAKDIDIGIVSGVLGMCWYQVDVVGRSCHAGPSPMHLRKDALVGASRMVLELTEMTAANGDNSRCTIGELAITNASTNVSPGEVSFSLDLREATEERLERLEQRAVEIMHRIADEQDLTLSVRKTWTLPPCHFDKHCLDFISKAAELNDPDMKTYTLTSGAGHDAVYINRVIPAAMIFVPSEKGLSHNECEYTRPEHLETGCNLLLSTLLLAANAVDN